MKRPLLALTLGLLPLLSLAGDDIAITIKDHKFSPAEVRVPAGQKQAYYTGTVNFMARYFADQSREYTVSKYEIGEAKEDDKDISVQTKVFLMNGQTYTVVWKLTPRKGGYKVADVKVLGFSLIYLQRGIFTSFLSKRNGDVAQLVPQGPQRLRHGSQAPAHGRIPPRQRGALRPPEAIKRDQPSRSRGHGASRRGRLCPLNTSTMPVATGGLGAGCAAPTATAKTTWCITPAGGTSASTTIR